MRTIQTMLIACALVSMTATHALAQRRFDVGLLLGSTHVTDEGDVLQFDRGTTYQATFDWWFWRNRVARLSIDVPFIATPAFTVLTPNPQLPLEYASLYLTPGLRVTFAPDKPVAVFGAIGAGYARYTESTQRENRAPNPAQRDTNTGALQVGGGVDVRGFGWLGFRGELRDVYTGARAFSIPTPGPNVHNVVGSGGLVVRF